MDEAEISVGDSLIEKISEALSQVDFVGAVISSSSVRSRWVKKELELAVHHELAGKRLRVLPLLIEDSELPSFLADRFYADFRTSYDQGFKALLHALGVGLTIGPHLPLLRSLEIPCSSSSYDQLPALYCGQEKIVLLWPEHADEEDTLFLYQFNRPLLSILSQVKLNLPRPPLEHSLWLIDNKLVGLIVLEGENEDATELWSATPILSGTIELSKILVRQGMISAVVVLDSDIVVVSSRNSELSIERIALSTGVVASARVGADGGGNLQITESEGLLYVVREIPGGLEWIAFDGNLSLLERKPLFQAKHPESEDAQFSIYDNCLSATGDDIFLTFMEYKNQWKDSSVRLARITRGGEVRNLWTLRSGRRGERSFYKPSVAAGEGCIVVSWNLRDTQHNYGRLDCEAFLVEDLVPIWPFERTLTRGPSASTGIQMAILDGKLFAAYAEASFDSLKMKITEIDLKKSSAR